MYFIYTKKIFNVANFIRRKVPEAEMDPFILHPIQNWFHNTEYYILRKTIHRSSIYRKEIVDIKNSVLLPLAAVSPVVITTKLCRVNLDYPSPQGIESATLVSYGKIRVE
jgi:hypothetical protein